jgi:outer membrane protein
MARRSLSRFLLAAAVVTGVAAAQTKVGVVNMQGAVLETDEIKKASQDLEAKYKPRQAQLEQLRSDLQGIQQKLQAGQGKLAPQAESELQAEGQRKQRDLQRQTQDLQEEVDFERNEILTRASRRMAAVVQKIAQAKDLDIVIDVSSTVYVKPVVDLTKEAVAEYNKTHGAGGAAPTTGAAPSGAAQPASPPK